MAAPAPRWVSPVRPSPLTYRNSTSGWTNASTAVLSCWRNALNAAATTSTGAGATLPPAGPGLASIHISPPLRLCRRERRAVAKVGLLRRRTRRSPCEPILDPGSLWTDRVLGIRRGLEAGPEDAPAGTDRAHHHERATDGGRRARAAPRSAQHRRTRREGRGADAPERRRPALRVGLALLSEPLLHQLRGDRFRHCSADGQPPGGRRGLRPRRN